MGAEKTRDLSADLELVVELAEVADKLSMLYWRGDDLRITPKPDGSIVTNADLETEAKLRELLRDARPGDAILGEEEGLEGDPANPYRWVIDPIDGTSNYARGRLGFGLLLGLAIEGLPTVGVVSMPGYGQRWYGAAGVGAYDLSGAPISVTGVQKLSEATVGISGASIWRKRGLDAGVDLIRSEAGGVYASGDASLFGDLACGRLEAGMVPKAKVWDLVASFAVVVAAGGVATDLAGQPRADGGALVAAATPELHAELMSRLNAR